MNIYRTETYRDATKFGGVIYASDFETDYRGQDEMHGSPIAKRIMQDWRFDKQCQKNYLGREFKRNQKVNREFQKEEVNV